MLPELAALLGELLGIAEQALAIQGLVFLRAAGIVAVLPAFGETFIPARVRLAVALAFSLAAAPLVADQLPPLDLSALPLVGLIVGETLAGLLIGIVLRLFVIVLQLAGTIAATSASITQVAGLNIMPDPMPAIGNILALAGLALAVVLGLHIKVVLALALSYNVFPIGGIPAPADIAEWGLAHVARAFALAFSLSAPFVLASFLYNLCLGAINRAMPQLMVAFVGAPVITGGSIFILFLSAPLILSVWHDAFDRAIAQPLALPP